MSWIGNAFLAMLGFVPVYFATGMLERNYNMRSDVTAVMWMAGISTSIACWIIFNGRGHELIPGKAHFGMLALAATVGAMANLCLFRSLAQNPNPGLTVAIVHSDAIVTLLLTTPIAMLLPNYFSRPDLKLQDIAGVISVVVGIALISIK